MPTSSSELLILTTVLVNVVFRPPAIEKKGLELEALQGKSTVAAPAAGTEQEGKEGEEERDRAAGASRVL